MKIKTSEATEQQLNWLVAKCEGEPTYIDYHGRPRRAPGRLSDEELYTPTTDWAQGGPIIEREGLNIYFDDVNATWAAAVWKTVPGGGELKAKAKGCPTPLIAAMRCYVASEMGEEVEIPDELIGE